MPSPSLEPLPEKPQGPAVAYEVMAEILGDDYFTSAALTGPESVTVMVIGVDGVPTQWAVRRTSLQGIFGRLRGSMRIRMAQQIPSLGMR